MESDEDTPSAADLLIGAADTVSEAFRPVLGAAESIVDAAGGESLYEMVERLVEPAMSSRAELLDEHPGDPTPD